MMDIVALRSMLQGSNDMMLLANSDPFVSERNAV
jgi:hypothetical protein